MLALFATADEKIVNHDKPDLIVRDLPQNQHIEVSVAHNIQPGSYVIVPAAYIDTNCHDAESFDLVRYGWDWLPLASPDPLQDLQAFAEPPGAHGSTLFGLLTNSVESFVLKLQPRCFSSGGCRVYAEVPALIEVARHLTYGTRRQCALRSLTASPAFGSASHT